MLIMVYCTATESLHRSGALSSMKTYTDRCRPQQPIWGLDPRPGNTMTATNFEVLQVVSAYLVMCATPVNSRVAGTTHVKAWMWLKSHATVRAPHASKIIYNVAVGVKCQQCQSHSAFT